MNPYQPPAAPVLPLDVGELRQPDASKGKRFLNFIIDSLISVWALGFAIGAFVPGAAEWAETLGGLEDMLLGLGLRSSYYLLMEGTIGVTLGKLATGTRVFDGDGRRKASFGQVIGRTLCRIIPFEPFSFFGGGPGGWHDTITNTRVLDMRARPVPPRRPPPPRGMLPAQSPATPRGGVSRPAPAPLPPQHLSPSSPPSQVAPPPPPPDAY